MPVAFKENFQQSYTLVRNLFMIQCDLKLFKSFWQISNFTDYQIYQIMKDHSLQARLTPGNFDLSPCIKVVLVISFL